jgi:hypothetical protein
MLDLCWTNTKQEPTQEIRAQTILDCLYGVSLRSSRPVAIYTTNDVWKKLEADYLAKSPVGQFPSMNFAGIPIHVEPTKAIAKAKAILASKKGYKVYLLMPPMTLKDFKNKHKDKKAYVLGTGPSLRRVKAGQFADGIVIAVNGAILKYPDADYYFTCDLGMTLWKSWLILKDIDCDLILASNCGFATHEHRMEGRKVFEGIDPARVHHLPRSNHNSFSQDALIKGSSSAHVAVNFACVLGCKPITLIGCDCRYEAGKKHYWNFPGQPDEGLVNPEHDKLRRPLSPDNPGGVTDGELQRHLAVWNEIKDLNAAAMANVQDRSGGALSEVFE